MGYLLILENHLLILINQPHLVTVKSTILHLDALTEQNTKYNCRLLSVVINLLSSSHLRSHSERVTIFLIKCGDL